MWPSSATCPHRGCSPTRPCSRLESQNALTISLTLSVSFPVSLSLSLVVFHGWASRAPSPPLSLAFGHPPPKPTAPPAFLAPSCSHLAVSGPHRRCHSPLLLERIALSYRCSWPEGHRPPSPVARPSAGARRPKQASASPLAAGYPPRSPDLSQPSPFLCSTCVKEEEGGK